METIAYHIHELRIRAAFILLRAAVCVEKWAGQEFKRLIKSRTPSSVALMERRKGLT